MWIKTIVYCYSYIHLPSSCPATCLQYVLHVHSLATIYCASKLRLVVALLINILCKLCSHIGCESSLLSSSSIRTQIIQKTYKVRMKEPLNCTMKGRTYRGSRDKYGGWTLQLQIRRRYSPRRGGLLCLV